ncbi:hypothetical protein WJX81_001564 [Elliptochloris bilobata]|uniref:Uncharacterized protein n=1 Tax=Elliptochloris bilobata TaxID=381761 RepID=A0AAW1RVJ9_9CHLO
MPRASSPRQGNYLAALANVFTPTAPLLFSARCRTAVLSGVANCLYGLTAAQQGGALALLTNLQGFAGLDFQQCSLGLDSGAPISSATCWADAGVGATVAAASPIPETLLGPTLFTQTLYDANPAVGGTGVGAIDIRFVCEYL